MLNLSSSFSTVWRTAPEQERFMEIVEDVGDDVAIELFRIALPDAATSLRSIQEALHRSDFNALASAAHKFKGTCVTVGFVVLGTFCGDLERAARSGDQADCSTIVEKLKLGVPAVVTALQLALTQIDPSWSGDIPEPVSSDLDR